MNVYTRREKVAMAIEDLAAKARMAFEVTLIVAGVAAAVALGFMAHRITELETELKEYEMEMEEMKGTSDDYIVIRDGLTGEVIYSGWR